MAFDLNYGPKKNKTKEKFYFCHLPHQILPVLTLLIVSSRAFSTVYLLVLGKSQLKLTFSLKTHTHTHTHPLQKLKPPKISQFHPKPHWYANWTELRVCNKLCWVTSLKELYSSLLVDGTMVVRKGTGIWHG